MRKYTNRPNRRGHFFADLLKQPRTHAAAQNAVHRLQGVGKLVLSRKGRIADGDVHLFDRLFFDKGQMFSLYLFFARAEVPFFERSEIRFDERFRRPHIHAARKGNDDVFGGGILSAL